MASASGCGSSRNKRSLRQSLLPFAFSKTQTNAIAGTVLNAPEVEVSETVQDDVIITRASFKDADVG